MSRFLIVGSNIVICVLLLLVAASLLYSQNNFGKELTESSPSFDEKTLAQISSSMITIPAGLYQLYCRSGDNCLQADIQIFQIMEHELTWDMYQPCIDVGVCSDNFKDGGDEGWGRGDRPMINVSFRDITEHYLPWLNNITGASYRLPTEEEWEYAAVAGSDSSYHWGDDIGVNQANCASCGSQWDGMQTAPVMSFLPNRLGLYDMYGNVWELTSNCSTGIDRKRATRCDSRVIRGGSYVELAHAISREFDRSAKPVDRKQSILGFRLAQDL